MVIDGFVTLGGSHQEEDDGLPSPGWGPTQFQAYQLRDILDLRALYPDGSTRTVIRLWSNQDVHLYGELVLHDGAIRSTNTMSIGCVTNDEDIVSFRSGTGTGDQVARVGAAGDYKIYQGGLSASLGSDALVYYSGGPARTKVTAGALSLYLGDEADDANLAVNLGIGEIRFFDEFTITGLDPDDATYRNATIDTAELHIKAWDTDEEEQRDWGYTAFTSSAASLHVWTSLGASEPGYGPLAFYAATVAVNAVDTTGLYHGDLLSLRLGEDGTPGTWVAGVLYNGSYNIYSESPSPGSLKALLEASGLTLNGDTGISVRLDDSGLELYAEDSEISAKLALTTLRYYTAFTIKGAEVGGDATGATVEADDLELVLTNGSGVERWGLFSTSSNTRMLNISGTGGSVLKPLKVEASSFALKLYNSGSVDWGVFKFDGGVRTIYVGDGGDQRLAVQATDFNLCLDNNGTVGRWGLFSTTSAHVRTVDISDDNGTARKLLLRADDLAFKDGSTDWGHLYVDGSVSVLHAYSDFRIDAEFSSTWNNIDLTGANITLNSMGSGVVKFVDSGATTRFNFTQSAVATMTSPNNVSASLFLNSSTTTAGRTWELRSDYTDGFLRIVNATDSGAVVVTRVGDLYTTGVMGPALVGGSPGSTAGQAGCIAFEYVSTSSIKLWVKIDSSTWKYATLALT